LREKEGQECTTSFIIQRDFFLQSKKVISMSFTHVVLFLYSALIKTQKAQCQWLTPVILATQEAESRKIVV
jgi:hypothetical protein